MEQRPLDEPELEVLTHFANGKSTEEIAQAMTLHKAPCRTICASPRESSAPPTAFTRPSSLLNWG
jgi:hypothetical protein